MTHWKTHLGSEKIKLIDGDRSARYPKEFQFVPIGIPFVNTTNIRDNHFDFTNLDFIPEEIFEKLTKGKLQYGDLVITTRGSIGNVARWPDIYPTAFINAQMLIIRPDESYVSRDYLYYLLTWETTQRRLKVISSGVAQPQLPMRDLKTVDLIFPEIDEQRRIAAILSAYDDLIENNRRRMTLLEQAARELYREWFARLRFPGYEHTRIVDGVPEGWEQSTLLDACLSVEDGDWVESKDQGGDDFRLLQISNIGVNEFVETGNFRGMREDTFRRLNCTEILPGDILISRMPTPIGRAWLVTEMPWRMITAVDVAIVKPDDLRADRYFLVYYLNSAEHLAFCERRASGATRPRIARRELVSLPVLIPTAGLQQSFHEIVEPISQLRAKLQRDNQLLRNARDLLLPRLMSGEISV